MAERHQSDDAAANGFGEDGDDTGLSKRHVNDGQRCSKALKDEPSSDDDDEEENGVFYKNLGMQ
jgi:hypothetical protein